MPYKLQRSAQTPCIQTVCIYTLATVICHNINWLHAVCAYTCRPPVGSHSTWHATMNQKFYMYSCIHIQWQIHTHHNIHIHIIEIYYNTLYITPHQQFTDACTSHCRHCVDKSVPSSVVLSAIVWLITLWRTPLPSTRGREWTVGCPCCTQRESFILTDKTTYKLNFMCRSLLGTHNTYTHTNTHT